MFELNKKDSADTSTETSTTASSAKRQDRQQAQSGEIAVIGRSITIDGNLRGEENLRIEGDINGTIQLPNHNLTIGKEGRIKADAYAESLIVEGSVDGDLFGAECVSVRSTARVEGNIVAARVNLEEGAQFKGSIDMDPKNVDAALGNIRKEFASSSNKASLDLPKEPSATRNTSNSGPDRALTPDRGKPAKAESAH